jgi:alpha-L-rhamnosidase
LLFQLELQYEDNKGKRTTQTIVSDETWNISTNGPIQENSNWNGEVYNAFKTEFNTEFNTANAQLVQAPTGKLRAQMMPPMRVVETIKPVSVTEVKPGVFVFDFGVNLVGNCTLQIPKGLPAGTRLQLRHAETLQKNGKVTLDKDGELYTANLRGAKCRDIYIASGDENDGTTYTPTFTFHGFRYAELTVSNDGGAARLNPTVDTLLARVINTDLPTIGKFKTNNETVNAIFRNIHRGTQGNYLSMPTDCPQRDERQGWQGDRAGEAKGEMMIFDSVTLYSKWLDDIEDSQRPDGNLSDVCPNFYQFYGSNVTWPSSFTIIPGTIYTMYGDKRPIEKHYDAMKRWLIGHLGQFVKDGLISKDNYGDWCVPPENPSLIHSRAPKRTTSKEVIATTYYIYNLKLLAKYAKMLGKTGDIAAYEAKADEMTKAFNAKYLKEVDGRIQIDNGTQTSCILPLQFGIIPKDKEEKVFATLINNIENVTNKHVGTGLIGGQWLNQTLNRFGRDDISWKFTTNKDYPSWGYMVEKGATTIWELWNGDTANPAMNSGNHVMLIGDLVIWYYENLAGIKADPEKPGFEHIIMKPTLVEGLDFVDAEINTVKGVIKSSWKRTPRFTWDIEIPVGSTATVYLPDGKVIENVPAGKHTF